MMGAFLLLAMTGLVIYAATAAYQGLAYAYVLQKRQKTISKRFISL